MFPKSPMCVFGRRRGLAHVSPLERAVYLALVGDSRSSVDQVLKRYVRASSDYHRLAQGEKYSMPLDSLRLR